MPIFLNNDDVEQLITMKDTMAALETLYREMGQGMPSRRRAPTFIVRRRRRTPKGQWRII